MFHLVSMEGNYVSNSLHKYREIRNNAINLYPFLKDRVIPLFDVNDLSTLIPIIIALDMGYQIQSLHRFNPTDTAIRSIEMVLSIQVH